MDTATNVGLDALKTTSKKVVHKAVEATGEFIRSKIATKAGKPRPVIDQNSRNVEEIEIPLKKREEILNKLGKVL